MRTKFTLFAIFIAIFLSGPAQQPPNGSFENWTNVYTPTGWAGLEVAFSSLHTFLTPTWTFKDTTTSTQGIASLKLVTDSPPGYTQILGGIISVGSATFANNKPIFSGIPFNYRPDTLIFDYQYSSPGTDTAASIVILTDSSGNNLLGPLGSHGVTVTLHNSSTWVHVAYVLTSYYQSPATPDSLMLGFTSSNNSPVVGSTLLVDNVRFGYYTGARISATIMASGLNVCPGDSVKLTANTGTNYTYQWNLGAQPIAGATSSTYYAKTGGSYTVTIDSASANATSLPVVITANCGSGSITATINPSGLNVCNGDSVLLAANNGVNYTFQWYRNGNGIIGATSVNYYAKTAGSYTVTIDSATASGTSTAVIITSNCGFTATIHSLGTNICNGDSVLLSANTGNNYTYHWKLNGTAIPGATFSTYYAKTAGSYTVTIDSALSIATSQPVVITANCGSGSITATINPSGLNVCNGDSVLLTANSGANYTWQWYQGVASVTGATSNTYYAKTAGSYTVKIDSASSTATSQPVVITANCGTDTLTATIIPSGTNVCNGDSVLLRANGGINYTYQWYLGLAPVTGATSSTYYAKTAGGYTVVIDSASFSTTSLPVAITANCGSGTITAIISAPNTNICNGDSVLLTANTGTGYTYQWNLDGTAINAATAVTYYAKTTGSYTVTIDSASAIGTSPFVAITDTGCVNGINNIAADNFSIYPNPASTLLNINSSENLAGSDLQVYDLVGRLVISQVLTGTNNAVDVAKLANGTYIFRITDKENNALTQSKFNVIK
jgi:hypothetical protein